MINKGFKNKFSKETNSAAENARSELIYVQMYKVKKT